ncbi:MAG: MotA/TolQ/ExbB proton channel family protein [Candidatus Nealsonbacteria bacterium]|nr:MotA/TolQ/ExbB proton channel family protein [Candidatus Nealsonbacteria bacterium]
MRRRYSWGLLGTSVFSFWLVVAVLGALTCLSLSDGPAAVAADDPAADELGDDGGGADPAPAKAADPKAGDDDEGKKADEESVLIWMARSLGWFYSIVFICLSFTLVALFVMNILSARRENVVPVALVEGFEAQLNEKRYQEAYEMAKNDESFLGQVLSAGLAKLSAGYDQAIEAMQEVGEEENMKLEHRLSYMALIGTVAPMIGLMGTVQGMIASFSVIATSATTPAPSELAAGISTALFTTLVGLFIAIPAIAAFNILRNRVARLVLEVGILSEGLMGRFSSVGAGGPQPKK